MLDAFESLLEQLQNPTPEKRLHALHDLLKEEHIASLPAQVFVTLFRTDPDGEVRLAALQGLASFGERVPVPTLLEMLADPDDEEWRIPIVDVLGYVGAKAPIELLVHLVQDESEEAGVRESALEALVRLQDRVPFSVFLQALGDEEPALRAVVAGAAAEGVFQVPLDLLVRCLADPDGVVRKEAVRAVTRSGAAAPIDPVVALLRDPEPRVRAEAALAVDVLLEWFGTRVPLDELVGLIGDPVFYVRETVIDALGNHPQRISAAPLAQALKDENLYVRLAAAEALVKMGQRVPIALKPILQEALNDPDPRVRHKIAFVLLVMGGLANPDDPPQSEMHVKEIG